MRKTNKRKATQGQPIFRRAGFMQPMVTEGEYWYGENKYGEGEWFPASMFSKDEVIEEGYGEDLELQKGFFAEFSAPGYMDRTPLGLYDTEYDAWYALLDFDDTAFVWTAEWSEDSDKDMYPEGVEPGWWTYHMYCPTDACAKAVKHYYQSVEGSSIEQDGSFVYVSGPPGKEELTDEIEVEEG